MLTLTDFLKTRATRAPLCILLLLTFRYTIVVNAACASGWTSVCGNYGNDCVTCTGSNCRNGNCKCCPPATTTTTTSSPSTVTSTTTTPSPSTTSSPTTTPSPATTTTTTLSPSTVTSTTTTPSPSTVSSTTTTPSPSTISSSTTTSSPSTVTSPTTASLTTLTTTTSTSTAAGGSTTTSGGATTRSPVNTTCLCNCTQYNALVSRLYNTPFQNLTEAEQNAAIAVRVEELRVKLTVPTDTLSSTVRRKTSAADNRVASKSIGLILGIGLLCVMLGSMLISDIRVFYHHIRHGPENKLPK